MGVFYLILYWYNFDTDFWKSIMVFFPSPFVLTFLSFNAAEFV